MHISEVNGRYGSALRNIFRAARSHVVIMENWTRHLYLEDIKALIQESSVGWEDAKFYYAFRKDAPTTRLMIVSKETLPYPELRQSAELIQGQEMNFNR